MVLRSCLIWLVLSVCTATAEAQVTERLPALQVRAKAYVRTWPDSARDAVRDSLAVARERWAQARPELYEWAVVSAPMMLSTLYDQRHDGHRRVLRIEGDAIVTILFERAPQYTRRTQWLDATVESVLQQLEAAVADSSRQVVRLEIDPVLGYPSVWHTDDARNGYGRYVSDQSDGGEVVLFRRDPPQASCGWWRRLTGRCA